MDYCAPFIILLLAFLEAEGTPCRKLRDSGEASYACACNSKFCDDINFQPKKQLKENKFMHYVSSRDGGRMELNVGNFIRNPLSTLENPDPVVIKVNTSERYQEIFGFGGAMTDSAGLNIASLQKAEQQALMRQYFGKNGSGYSFIRVPFGGTDFSTRNYSYDDTINDTSLKHFALQYEDLHYKIPYIKLAQKMSPVEVKLISASWSPPEWMKESRNGTVGFTRLQKKYYQLYSDYYIKCLNAYKKNGLKFWGISPQNEPFVGLGVFYNFNSMGFTPEEMRQFIGEAFGPTLHSRGYEDLKLMILDDNRVPFLPGWPVVVLKDSKVNKYVSGIAIHWYFDNMDPTGQLLNRAHHAYPDKFLLYTESSVVPIFDKSVPNPKAVRLGNWERAENYTSNIIQDLNHWVTGWIDWNLVLDTQGGPNWVGNHVEAAIITNATANEFYKQPLFYALAHFSKFVPPGSRRIAYKISSDTVIECAAFLRPDGLVTIILQNRRDVDVDVVVLLENRQSIVIPAGAHSINTVLYKPKHTSSY